MKEAEKAQKEKVSSDMPKTEALEIFSEIVQAAKNKNKDKKVVISQSGNVIAIKKQAGVSKEIPQVSNVFKEKYIDIIKKSWYHSMKRLLFSFQHRQAHTTPSSRRQSPCE